MSHSINRQLGALLRTRWMLSKTEKWQTMAECTFAVLAISILAVFVFLFGEMSTFDPSSSRVRSDVILRNSSLLLSTSGNFTLLSAAIARACNVQRVVAVSNRTDLLSIMQSYVDGRVTSPRPSIVGGVDVNRTGSNVQLTFAATDFFVSPKAGGFHDQKDIIRRNFGGSYQFGYRRSQLIELFSCVSEALIRTTSPANADINRINVVSRSFPTYLEDISFSAGLEQFIITGFAANILLMQNRIVNNAQSGRKRYLKLMGLNSGVYWLSHFIETIIPMAVASLLLTTFAALPASADFSSNMFYNMSPALFFVVLLSYCISRTILGIALAAAVPNKTKLFFIVGIKTLLSVFTPPHILSEHSETASAYFPTGFPLLACLFPNAAFKTILAEVRAIGLVSKDGAGLSEVVRSTNFTDSEVSIPSALLMMVIGSVLTIVMIAVAESKFFLRLRKKAALRSEKKWVVTTPKVSGHEINVRNVSKDLQDPICRLQVLDTVNLIVENRKITALLGPPSSGKSTLLNIITGDLIASKGAVFVDHYNVLLQPNEVRSIISASPPDSVFYEDLTVQENLRLFNGIRGLKSNQNVGETIIVLRLLNLSDKKKVLVKDLSRASLRKLAIGAALIGGSKIIILDDPTEGLDEDSARQCWSLLRRLSPDHTFLVATSNVSCATEFASSIAVLVSGRLRTVTTGKLLQKAMEGKFGYELAFTKNKCFNRKVFENFVHKRLDPKQVATVDTKDTFVLDIEKRVDVTVVNGLINDVVLSKENIGATFSSEINFTEIEIFQQLYRQEAQVYEPVRRHEPKSGLTLMQLLADNFLERLQYHKNNLKDLIWFLVPAAFLLIQMVLWEFAIASKSSAWQRSMRVDNFYNYPTQGLVAFSSTVSNDTQVARQYMNVFESSGTVLRNLANFNDKDVEDFVRNSKIQSIADNYHIGASFFGSTTSWHNERTVHALPVSVANVYEAIYGNLTNTRPASSSFEIVTHALDQPVLKDLFIAQPLRLVYTVFLTLIFAVMSSFQTAYPTYFRLVHNIPNKTNKSLFAFWAANAFVGWQIHSIFATLIFALASSLGLKFGAFPYASVALLLVSGLAMVPFSYLLVHATKERRTTAFATLIALGLIIAIESSYWEIKISNQSGQRGLIIGYKMLQMLAEAVFPTHALLTGINKIAHLNALTSVCSRLPTNILDRTCNDGKRATLDFYALGFSAGDIYKCCQESCQPRRQCLVGESFSSLSFGRHGILSELVMLAIDALIYWIILWRVERQHIREHAIKFE